MAKRTPRVHLARSERDDAGTDDFAQERALIDHECRQHRDEARYIGAGQQRNEEIAPQDEHQERHAPGEIDERCDRPAQQRRLGEPRQREEDTDRKGESDAECRKDQRIGEPAKRPVRILADQQQQPVVLDDGDHVVDHARALLAGSVRIDR